MDESNDSQDRSNNAENENLGNRRKRRRLASYLYESDSEFDGDFSGNEDGDETWIPSRSNVEDVDSDNSSFEEKAENIRNFNSSQRFRECSQIVGRSNIASATTSQNIEPSTSHQSQSSVSSEMLVTVSTNHESSDISIENTSTDAGFNIIRNDDESSTRQIQTDSTNGLSCEYTAKEIEQLYVNGKLSLCKRSNYAKKKTGVAISSNVWEKFNVVSRKETNEIITQWVQCGQCLKFLKYNGTTTTGLLKHKCPKKDKNQSVLESFLSIPEKQSKDRTIKFSEADKKQIRDSVEQFIVQDIRPFYAIEGDGLRTLLRAAIQIGRKYPTINQDDIDHLIPSRFTMRRHVQGKAIDSKSNIAASFQQAIDSVGGFSCTADLYTDQYKSIGYLGITAKMNIIENDIIIQKEFVVHLDEFDAEKKNADAIEIEIEKIFTEYGISKDQIAQNITWTTDRGGNIRNALGNISKRLNCFAHLLNNIVHKMCNKTIAKSIVTDAAALVRYLKRSGLANKLQVALKSYCETRWNTVYDMLESILINYDSIKEILAQRNMTEKIDCLPQIELNKIAAFLKIFATISTKIQGEKYETMHLVWPYINKVQKHLISDRQDSIYVSEMKSKGREYLSIAKSIEDFSLDIDHKVAVFLHPAMKSLNNAAAEDSAEIIEHIRSLITTRYLESQKPDEANNNANEVVENMVIDDIFGEFLNNRTSGNTLNAASDLVNHLAEIDNYINFKVPSVIDLQSFELTRWWYEHRKSFPNLFRIFLRNSANTATSAPSERAFSTTGRILEPRRCSMLPSMINTIMLARNSYNRYRIIS